LYQLEIRGEPAKIQPAGRYDDFGFCTSCDLPQSGAF
jgi:hypothetical protein